MMSLCPGMNQGVFLGLDKLLYALFKNIDLEGPLGPANLIL